MVLTVIYTLNFSWQLLYFKGIAIVRAMQDDSSNQISLVIEPLVSVLSVRRQYALPVDTG